MMANTDNNTVREIKSILQAAQNAPEHTIWVPERWWRHEAFKNTGGRVNHAAVLVLARILVRYEFLNEPQIQVSGDEDDDLYTGCEDATDEEADDEDSEERPHEGCNQEFHWSSENLNTGGPNQDGNWGDSGPGLIGLGEQIGEVAVRVDLRSWGFDLGFSTTQIRAALRLLAERGLIICSAPESHYEVVPVASAIAAISLSRRSLQWFQQWRKMTGNG